MKKLIITAAATVLLFASAANAADQKVADPHGGMMQGGDMMKNCHMHMKDGKMLDTMPKDMMAQCQKMMKDMGDIKQPDSGKAEMPAMPKGMPANGNVGNGK